MIGYVPRHGDEPPPSSALVVFISIVVGVFIVIIFA